MPSSTSDLSVDPLAVVESLTQRRLLDLGRELGIAVPSSAPKAEQARRLALSRRFDFEAALRLFTRDELREACRAAGLDDAGRARIELAARLLAAQPTGPFDALDGRAPDERDPDVPIAGDVALVRQRQYLVQEVVPASGPARGRPGMTRVRLVCLDDDAQGRPLEVLWELELGARIVQPRAEGLGRIRALDEPRFFAAYLHALRWHSVTATDPNLFQSPFRAGIQLKNHQLTPLQKALRLPRANLFIADDVGLGKTIEAGLVLQELLLRQRVDYTLVVCPASVALQWRDEMRTRFGLHFEIYNRALIGQRQKERGFGVNPWSTHTRFIVSYQTVRRPEHRDPLLAYLGERARKSLLVLDEAHTAAPASSSKYAVDSNVTRVVRDLAPRFENRLFLSATPHNGHSNSFAALLEILDPQRFTRGVPVTDAKALEPVMVRRLKSDLRELGLEFPKRRLLQLELRHDGRRWQQRVREGDALGPAEPIGDQEPFELVLAEQLARYTKLMKPRSGRGRLVFINLQKRLLSSVEAFWRTLNAHARGRVDLDEAAQSEVAESEAQAELALAEDVYGVDDDAADAMAAHEAVESSRYLPSPAAEARDLLDAMLDLSERRRHAPDAKLSALLTWIRAEQCPAAGLPARERGGDAGRWTDRRLLVFTEYGDTKRYLVQRLNAALEGTDRAAERVLVFHGGMGDEARDEVQRAFNSQPDEDPVRLLVATDAAREGVNLQGHCADLVHYDIPWNPARLEQRNGRLDRTLQPSPEVRCRYFIYPDRPEDHVLTTLIHKIDVIQDELGSLGAVLMDRLEAVLAEGIDETTSTRIDETADPGPSRAVVEAELETQRRRADIKAEIDSAGRVLNRSRKLLDFDGKQLRETVDVGLELARAGRLARHGTARGEHGPIDAFTLPELPPAWAETVDTLRPARGRSEPFWEWRKQAPRHVVFAAPGHINAPVVHLHLEHPFVQRILARFRAQGYAADDLSRVTVVRHADDSLAHAIAFGRLSLFGHGAARLHDELVVVSAPWLEARGEGHLEPGGDDEDERLVKALDAALLGGASLGDVPDSVHERLVAAAPTDFAALWPHVEAEAEALAQEAVLKLSARGEAEETELRGLLERQRALIEKRIAQLELDLGEVDYSAAERRQVEADRGHMADRYRHLEREIREQPPELRTLYEVVLRRLEPVGLVYLWPGTR